GVSSRADRIADARFRPGTGLHRFHSRRTPGVFGIEKDGSWNDMARVAAIIPAMNSASTRLLPALLCLFLAARLHAADEPKLSPLPAPVSNNAVAISHDEGGARIFSFMGIGPKKTWDAITTSAYEMDPGSGKWEEKRPVPGVAGRLGASAVALHDQVFIFGGYVVD